MDLNEMYDLILGPVESTPPPPSLEAMLEWMRQIRDVQDKGFKFHIADSCVENLEELKRVS